MRKKLQRARHERLSVFEKVTLRGFQTALSVERANASLISSSFNVFDSGPTSQSYVASIQSRLAQKAELQHGHSPTQNGRLT